MYPRELIFLFFVISSFFRGFRVMDDTIQKIPSTRDQSTLQKKLNIKKREKGLYHKIHV